MTVGSGGKIRIPPHDPAYKLEAEREFETDAMILSYHIHMHLRSRPVSAFGRKCRCPP